MENKIYVYKEDGEEIAIEIILSFEIEELNKKFIAYTLNDDGNSETVPVFISEYDGKNIKDISNEEADLVLEYYNSAKELVNEEFLGYCLNFLGNS